MKKKILHVSCGGLGYGGVSSVIFSIVENLYKDFDFDCVVFKKKCGNESKFLKYGNLHRINAYNSNGKRSIFEMLTRPFVMFVGIYKICKRNKYDAIHVHNNFEEGICLFAAMVAGVKVRIAHSHNTPIPKKENFFNRIKEKINVLLIKKNATVKIGCSEAACRLFFHSEEYEVIYNSVDLSRFVFNRKNNSDNVMFIHVGRYTYQKNQEFVIKVFSEISKSLSNVNLRLVGFGDDKDKLQELVKSLSLENIVQFVPGDKVDIIKEYDKAQYMIFPSNFEGFGIVLIEAQAKGIRCFVSKEAIQKEADAGLLTYISLKKTPKEWADIIVGQIKNNEDIDYSLISNNLKKYGKDEISKQYLELYRRNIYD